MNRAQLQRLAEDRIIDAQALLDTTRWAAAYYLAGYSVECALKSCVLAHIEKTGMIYRDRKYLRSLADCWTHDLDMLVDLSGLTEDFGKARGMNRDLAGYWGVVSNWSETSRYDEKGETESQKLVEAITHEPNGVLPWIRTRW